MIPDNLPRKFRRHSTLSREEYNALVQGTTGFKFLPEGATDSQSLGGYDRNLQYDNYFTAISYDELPPYSVFAIRKPADVPDNHYGPFALEVGIFTHTSRYPLLTNGESDGRFNVSGGVTAGAVRAKAIGWDVPVYVRVNPSPAVPLKIGYPCGPVPGQTYVDGDRTGLICVAFDTDKSLAQVVATQPGAVWLVKPNSSIGPFSTGTVTVWVGQVGSEVVSDPVQQLANVRNVTSGSFASGTFAFVVAIEGQLYLFPMGGNAPVVLTIIGNSMGDTVGETIGPAVDCLFRAKITGISAANGTAFCNESKYTVGTEVWVVVIDRPGGSTHTPAPKLTVGDRFIAVLAQDSYTVDPGGPQEEAHAVYAIRKGAIESMAVVTIQPISGETVGTVIGPANDKCLFKGKITAIADDGYCDETPYSVDTDVWILVLDRPGGASSTNPRLTVGDRFLAKLVVDNFTVGEDEEADSRPIYAIGKRGDDSVRLVTIMDQDAETGSCLWSAQLTVPPDMEEQLNFCEDPFDIGEEVWVLILNSDLGSFAPTNKIRPSIGEQYIGKYIGNYALDNVPIYCIRVEMNDIYHVTAGFACSIGASAVFSLPVHGGVNVTATNWSSSNIGVGDKVVVFKDHAADTWYAIKAGGSSYEPRLARTSADHDVDVTQDVYVWKGTPGSETESTGPITLSATNKTNLEIKQDTWCLAFLVNVADAAAAPNMQWYIIPLLTPAYTRLVKTTTAHGPGSTADVNVWQGTPGSETISTGPIVLSATNRSPSTIPDDTFCLATLTDLGDAGDATDLHWYLIPLATSAEIEFGIATSIITAFGGTGDIEAYEDESTPVAGPLVISGKNLTGAEIPEFGWVKATKIRGNWYFEPWTCEAAF